MENGRKEVFFGCDRMEIMAHVIGKGRQLVLFC